MALLSALDCPLISSEKRTLSTAAKTVCRAYQKFSAEYYEMPAEKDSTAKEGSFRLSCFISRPNVGYLIIAVYQGVREDGCALKAGFLEDVRVSSWKTIANTLFIGLGVEADKITPSAMEKTGRELLALLASSSESRLEAYLLSLLLPPKVYILTTFVNYGHMRAHCCDVAKPVSFLQIPISMIPDCSRLFCSFGWAVDWAD
jgi:hypothetical protein